ncbi:mRNA interferase HigB [Variovorax sp. GrIS 2.14]|uniref:type II toxin-antitoxin system HigB family toxin n=1 Tax=Variovorax sp. GrIS 2.14 TaxID=3071709 RepID=UPI0038F6C055
MSIHGDCHSPELVLKWPMHIVAQSNLTAYYQRPNRGDAKAAIEAWLDVAKLAKWTSWDDVKAQYANSSPVGGRRVVFNIAGNKHRLIVAFAYQTQWGFVKFIGTHAEYDSIDAATVDQFK